MDAKLTVSTPMLDHDGEYMLTGQGPLFLRLESLLARSRTATVFTVNAAPLVIKYQTSCGEGIHPLLRDFWILRHLESTGLTPKAFMVSPEVPFLASNVTLKTSFDMPQERRDHCANRNGTVRYLAMERTGPSLFDLVYRVVDPSAGQQVKVSAALGIVRDLVRGIRAIHAHGIVHGDLHEGNVVVMSGKKIGLIDFGRSLFVDEIDWQSEAPRRPNLHCSLTPYGLLGGPLSYRDDVFNALWLGAALVNGSRLRAHCEELVRARRADDLYAMKKSAPLFPFPHGRDFLVEIAGLDDSERDAIRYHLSLALEFSRNVSRPSDLPDYTAILAHLEAAIEIVPEDQ